MERKFGKSTKDKKSADSGGPVDTGSRKRCPKSRSNRSVNGDEGFIVKRDISMAIPVLPPEMFKKILSYVNETKDLINCARAAPVLDGLLTARKPIYLFCAVLPHLANFISPKDIANCRLVCKDWLKSTDKIADRLPAKLPYDNEFYRKQMQSQSARFNAGATSYSMFDPMVSMVCTLDNLRNFEETYDALYETTRNPFFGRSVKFLLQLTNDNDTLDLLHRIMRFLTKFGEHIWYLTFKVQENQNPDPSRFLVYKHFPSFLRVTPNLRSFTLTIVTPGDAQPHVFEELDRDVCYILRNTSTPVLPRLESLDFLHSAGVTQALSRIIVEPYLRNLQKLTITRWKDEYSVHLPSLVELNVAWITSNQELENLEKVSACHLRRFCANFRYPKVDSRILLRVLNRFPCLSVVDLDWLLDQPSPPPTLQVSGTPKPGTRIMCVHTVHICNSTGINYSFLRWFPNLRFLFILERLPQDGRSLETPPSGPVMKRITSREVVQIHKYIYSGQMHSSNIWDWFPLLKTVVFERCWMPEIGNLRNGNLEALKMAWESDHPLDCRRI